MCKRRLKKLKTNAIEERKRAIKFFRGQMNSVHTTSNTSHFIPWRVCPETTTTLRTICLFVDSYRLKLSPQTEAVWPILVYIFYTTLKRYLVPNSREFWPATPLLYGTYGQGLPGRYTSRSPYLIAYFLKGTVRLTINR
jgi:hypothetical protein